MAVAGCALSLAVLSRRPEPFVAALPPLLALLPLALPAPPLHHPISPQTSRPRRLASLPPPGLPGSLDRRLRLARLRRRHRARRHPPVRARRPRPASELARVAAAG